MQELAVTLGAFIEANKAWAGLAVGVIAFMESTILIGILFPATPFLLLIGGLVGSGAISPVPILVAAVIGAVAGDALGYYVGRWIGPGLLRTRLLASHRTAVAQARLFFRRFGFGAVFLGRFFGPVRCTVPLAAGMVGMDNRRYQLANLLSALVWAPVMIAPGYLAARSLAEVGEMSEAHWLGLAIGLTAAATVIAAVGVALLNRRPARRLRARAVRIPSGNP